MPTIDEPIRLATQIERDLRLFDQLTAAGGLPSDAMRKAQRRLSRLAALARAAGMRGAEIEISQTTAELARLFHENVERAFRPCGTA